MGVQVQFEGDKGVPDIDVDVYVNAASITPLEASNWGGVAGSIYRALASDPLSKKILENDWNIRGKKIEAGRAEVVKDEGGQPVKLQWPDTQAYLIHAGAPMNNRADDEPARAEKLKSAYFSILLEASKLQTTHQPIRVAIPPLGIGIYGNSPELSADAAYEALREFDAKYPDKNIAVSFPIFNTKDNSKDSQFKKALESKFGIEVEEISAPRRTKKPLIQSYKDKQKEAEKEILTGSKGNIKELYKQLNTKQNKRAFHITKLSLKGPAENPNKLHLEMKTKKGTHDAYVQNTQHGLNYSLGKVIPESETSKAVNNICYLAAHSAPPGTVFDLSKTPDDKLVQVYETLLAALKNKKDQNITIKVDPERLKALQAEKSLDTLFTVREKRKLK